MWLYRVRKRVVSVQQVDFKEFAYRFTLFDVEEISNYDTIYQETDDRLKNRKFLNRL